MYDLTEYTVEKVFVKCYTLELETSFFILIKDEEMYCIVIIFQS